MKTFLRLSLLSLLFLSFTFTRVARAQPQVPDCSQLPLPSNPEYPWTESGCQNITVGIDDEGNPCIALVCWCKRIVNGNTQISIRYIEYQSDCVMSNAEIVRTAGLLVPNIAIRSDEIPPCIVYEKPIVSVIAAQCWSGGPGPNNTYWMAPCPSSGHCEIKYTVCKNGPNPPWVITEVSRDFFPGTGCEFDNGKPWEPGHCYVANPCQND